jgi:hypothetical protein
MMAGRRRLATALLGATAALVLAAAPLGVGANGFSTHALAAPAGAGGASSGNSGKGAGNGNSGIGNAGNSGKSSSGRDSSGKGNSGKGNAGGDAGKANSGNASPGNAGPGSGDPAAQRAGGAAARFDSDFGSAPNEHVNPVTGTMIEINGSNVEVLHRDGFREEIVDGRYSMNDAQGRLIVERSATESDRARFRAMLRF